MKKNSKQFWVTNIRRDKDLRIEDLCIVIRAGQSRNLLEPQYKYTQEQLDKSRLSGSLFKKSKFLKVREVAPDIKVRPGVYVSKSGRQPPPLRSSIKITEKKYDDLELLDERIAELEFAKETAEFEAEDHAPATLAVDKKYIKEEKK